MTRKDTQFGSDLKLALKEVHEHRRGRKLDVTASILMTVIEREPDVVEATVASDRLS